MTALQDSQIHVRAPARKVSLPGWLFFLLALAAPLSMIRLSSANLTLFDILTLVALLLFLQRGGKLRYQSWFALAYVLVLSLLFATFRAPDPIAALTHVAQWLFIFAAVVPLIYSAVRTEGGQKLIVVAIVLVTLAIVAYGVYQVVTEQRNRYGSIYDDPQLLGFRIAALYPFLLVALRSVWDEATSRIAKIVSLLLVPAIAGGMFWLLFYSLSRTGVLATIIAILAFFAFDVIAVRNPSEFWKRFFFGALLVAALLFAVLRLTGDTSLTERVVERVAQTVDLESPEVTDRTVVWREALTGIDSSYYFLGVGPDNYQNISRYNKKPHNVFLLFLAEGGFVALLAFSGLLGYYFAITIPVLWSSRRRPSFARTFLAGATASMVAYTVIAMLNTQTLDRIYWLIFAAGLATAVNVRASMKAAVR